MSKFVAFRIASVLVALSAASTAAFAMSVNSGATDVAIMRQIELTSNFQAYYPTGRATAATPRQSAKGDDWLVHSADRESQFTSGFASH